MKKLLIAASIGIVSVLGLSNDAIASQPNICDITDSLWSGYLSGDRGTAHQGNDTKQTSIIVSDDGISFMVANNIDAVSYEENTQRTNVTMQQLSSCGHYNASLDAFYRGDHYVFYSTEIDGDMFNHKVTIIPSTLE